MGKYDYRQCVVDLLLLVHKIQEAMKLLRNSAVQCWCPTAKRLWCALSRCSWYKTRQNVAVWTQRRKISYGTCIFKIVYTFDELFTNCRVCLNTTNHRKSALNRLSCERSTAQFTAYHHKSMSKTNCNKEIKELWNYVCVSSLRVRL